MPSSHFGGEWQGGETGARRQLTGWQPARRRSCSKEEEEDLKGGGKEEGGGRGGPEEGASVSPPAASAHLAPSCADPTSFPQERAPPSQSVTATPRGEAHSPGLSLESRHRTLEPAVCAPNLSLQLYLFPRRANKVVSVSRETELSGLPVTSAISEACVQLYHGDSLLSNPRLLSIVPISCLSLPSH